MCIFSRFWLVHYVVCLYSDWLELYYGFRFTIVNPLYRKRWWLCILPAMPCEPSTTNKQIETHIFLRNSSLYHNLAYARLEVFRTFLCVFMCCERFKGFLTLRIMGKCTSRHFCLYSGLKMVLVLKVKFKFDFLCIQVLETNDESVYLIGIAVRSVISWRHLELWLSLEVFLFLNFSCSSVFVLLLASV